MILKSKSYKGLDLGEFHIVDNRRKGTRLDEVKNDVCQRLGINLIAVKHKNFPQAVEDRDISFFLDELRIYWKNAQKFSFPEIDPNHKILEPKIAVIGASSLVSLHRAPIPALPST